VDLHRDGLLSRPVLSVLQECHDDRASLRQREGLGPDDCTGVHQQILGSCSPAIKVTTRLPPTRDRKTTIPG
jgi:hypothetical protein